MEDPHPSPLPEGEGTGRRMDRPLMPRDMIRSGEERQRELPLKKAAAIAWKGIRVRPGRSLLVAGGIILPITFLMYVLCTEALSIGAQERGSRELMARLMARGVHGALSQEDMALQTRWMVGLALLISFVGILNAMLMSVTERFREIGTMKCLGALDSFVVRLFLLESTFQGVGGTLIGILLGLALAFGEGLRLYGGETMRLVVPGELGTQVAIALVAGVGLTIAGAVYPALRAARMKPADAMRTEI